MNLCHFSIMKYLLHSKIVAPTWVGFFIRTVGGVVYTRTKSGEITFAPLKPLLFVSLLKQYHDFTKWTLCLSCNYSGYQMSIQQLETNYVFTLIRSMDFPYNWFAISLQSLSSNLEVAFFLLSVIQSKKVFENFS